MKIIAKNSFFWATIVGLIAVFIFISMSVGIARAEDNENQSAGDEQTQELQKKQDEQARESAKQQWENAREADKQQWEADREAKKKQWESDRETRKKMSEGSTTEDRNGENEGSRRENDSDADEYDNGISFAVHNLLSLASTTGDRGIGEEVRKVAHEQNDKKDAAMQAISDIKSRNAFISFLIGANTKGLNQLKDSANATTDHINKLTEIANNANTPADVKIALNSEISALSAEKDHLSKIVSDNENKVSLFGWLIKMFQ